MDCGGSHNFSLTSTSEYFTVYFFYPDLSNLEFNQVTNFLKLVFSWDCKEVHLYLVFGCLFSEMVLPLGLLGTLVLLINYKIPETTGYSFIHVFVHVILNLMLFLVWVSNIQFLQDTHQTLEPWDTYIYFILFYPEGTYTLQT